jgi:hypothetical protein
MRKTAPRGVPWAGRTSTWSEIVPGTAPVRSSGTSTLVQESPGVSPQPCPARAAPRAAAALAPGSAFGNRRCWIPVARVVVEVELAPALELINTLVTSARMAAASRVALHPSVVRPRLTGSELYRFLSSLQAAQRASSRSVARVEVHSKWMHDATERRAFRWTCKSANAVYEATTTSVTDAGPAPALGRGGPTSRAARRARVRARQERQRAHEAPLRCPRSASRA